MLGAMPIAHEHTWVPYCGPFPGPGWRSPHSFETRYFFIQLACDGCPAKRSGSLAYKGVLTRGKVKDAVNQMNIRSVQP